MAIRLEVVPTAAALADAAAARFLAVVKDALAQRGVCRVALAGGSTPRGAYERIASEWQASGAGIVWSRIHVYWGDERMVAPDDPRSNYGMARAALLSKVPIPADNVHAVPTDAANAASAAARYDEALRAAATAGDLPRFDLVFLGLGADGHTASLFPGAPTLDETARLATVAKHPDTGEPRVTMTFPVLNHAAALIALVSGAEKARVLERVVRGVGRPAGSPLLPAERLKPNAGTLTFLADEDAAPWARSANTGPNT